MKTIFVETMITEVRIHIEISVEKMYINGNSNVEGIRWDMNFYIIHFCNILIFISSIGYNAKST